jgi:hypothetical protein
MESMSMGHDHPLRGRGHREICNISTGLSTSHDQDGLVHTKLLTGFEFRGVKDSWNFFNARKMRDVWSEM